MAVLGHINVWEFLIKTKGHVRGRLITDAKDRIYHADYAWEENGDYVLVYKENGNGNKVKIKKVIELDESLISFFGLYSGDGAKGSEDLQEIGTVKPTISFSQREPNLVQFAVSQFKKIFPIGIHFNFALGEDSAYFMDGLGFEMLKKYYGGNLPDLQSLDVVRHRLDEADRRYLLEKRSVKGTNEEHLAFYYQHKAAMQAILTAVKADDIKRSRIELARDDKVTASLRRPFKKGARGPGGSSRSDEMHIGGLTGFGEFFLKMLHEIEDSIHSDTIVSTQGLIRWMGKPSQIGEVIAVKKFFSDNPYGSLANVRPSIINDGMYMLGKWPRSKEIHLHKELNIDPLFCYVAGLYLAEGSTPKSKMFSMFNATVSGLSLSFTSSENISIDLVFKSMQKLFKPDECVSTWKIKVGSQYFPELVVIGLKHGVPMLRGGESGDGKLRTMEISLSLKEWALEVAPALLPFADKYSHVEPTGAGLARIDFSASSALCKWYFPLLMYASFGTIVLKPAEEFLCE